jgi:hypothetical protein
MDEEILEIDDSLNTSEEVTPEVTDESETATEESVEEVKAQLAKAKELADNYKVRAEKAEKKAKEAPKEKEPSLSTQDLIALMNAKVNEDDISEVEDYARFKKISIKEALKTSTIKTFLAEREEQRNVAAATNVSAARRSPSRISEETLISKASKGELPESDDEIKRLAEARISARKKK